MKNLKNWGNVLERVVGKEDRPLATFLKWMRKEGD